MKEKERKREVQRIIPLNGMSPSNPSPQSSRDAAEEKAERIQETEGMKDTWRARPSK